MKNKEADQGDGEGGVSSGSALRRPAELNELTNLFDDRQTAALGNEPRLQLD